MGKPQVVHMCNFYINNSDTSRPLVIKGRSLTLLPLFSCSIHTICDRVEMSFDIKSPVDSYSWIFYTCYVKVNDMIINSYRFFFEPLRWISDRNKIPNKLAYNIGKYVALKLAIFIKIVKLYVISKLIWVPILIGNPPLV